MIFALRQPRTIVICLIAAVVGFATMGCSSSKPNPDDEVLPMTTPDIGEAQELFVQANDFLDNRQWEQAIRRYNQVIQIDPQRWDAHMNRGIALARSNDFTEATEAFAQALENGGADEAIVYFNLGNLYQERGLYDSAIDAYRTSMAVGGGLDYDTLLNLAASYTFLHAYEPALQTIERAIDLNPDDRRAYLTLGLITFSDEQAPRALELYAELLASEPDFAEAHFNYGFILMRTQQLDEAKRSFETYLELDPDGPYVRQSEGHIESIQRRSRR